jgi:membrane protease subunit HflK
MAWIQPGKPARLSAGQRPGERRNPGPGGSPEPDPPGLDEVLERLNQLFGQGMRPGRLLLLAFTALLLTWGGFGFHLVGEGERALLLRGGRLQALLAPGLHWAPPLLSTVTMVSVDAVRQATLATTVLTRDEALAEVTLDLHYRVADPAAYLLGFAEAETALLRVADAVLQEAAATLPLAELQQSRSLGPALQRTTDARLARYRSGLVVTGINLTAVAPPAEVRAVIENALHAREAAAAQEARIRREVQQSLRAARAEAGRVLDAAARESARRQAAARDERERFARDLALYRTDPGAARELVYRRALADVMARTRTVVAGEGGLEQIGIPAPRLQPSPLPTLPDGVSRRAPP